MKRLIIALLLLPGLSLAPAMAAKTDSLQRFFRDVKTYSAHFDQVVLDEGLNLIQESSGNLWIERPGKFRWHYDKPFEQHIVGDGEKVWSYDVELQQVTVRPTTGALGYTPAILMAGRGRLKDNFTVKPLGRQGSLEWTQMMPKKKDGGFEDIRIGFENGRIRVLEMVDSFDQTTRLTLSEAKENKKIDPDKFRFKVPQGVDVVGQ